MPDMYDKLGDMLNEALESGKIPTDRHCEAEGRSKPSKNKNDQIDSHENAEETGHFSFKESKKTTVNNKTKSEKAQKDKKSAVPTGEVIKLHKYTYNMQFPLHIQKALDTLDIAYPFKQKDITKQYHKLLKENHPDTKKTIQVSQNVENIRQKSIDEITEAYKILSDFFGIK